MPKKGETMIPGKVPFNAEPKPVAVAKNQPRVVERAVILNCAQHTANWVFTHLKHVGGVDEETAREVSKDAGDAAGILLIRDLETHGYQVR